MFLDVLENENKVTFILGIINIRRKRMEWFIVNNAKGLQTVLSQLELFDQKFFEIPHWILRKQKRLYWVALV